jgi:hypothetical protein
MIFQENWNHVLLCILRRLKSQVAKNFALITGGLTGIVPNSIDGLKTSAERKQSVE